MRIIGGSFGTSGRIEIGSFGVRIKASRQALYPPQDLASVHVRHESDRRFGWIGFIIGSLLFGGLALLIVGPLIALLVLLLCLAGSFYRKNRYLADLAFSDGATLTLETTRRQADQLVQLK